MRFFFALCIALFNITTLSAQSLRVRVVSTSGEPVQGATVSLRRSADQTPLRVLGTDPQGEVVLGGLEAGNYVVRVEIISFQPAERRVSLTANVAEQVVEIRLTEAPVVIEGVTAQGERTRMRFEEAAGATVRELSKAELKLIPGLAEADVMRAVEALPGVVSTSDFSSAFNVRGGSADQNLILLDGIPIYNPFHLGGVFSVFNSDLVERAELMAGGFPAQ